MTPISIHMASLGMTLLALYCLGTQISVPMITSQLRHWRTLLAICIGQWLVLPVILACYLAILGGNDRETLAVAVVAMAPAGMFAVTALYLIGISFSAALVGVLLLEILGAILLFGAIDLFWNTEIMPADQLQESLTDMSRSQLVLLFLPMLVGLATRYLFPSLGPMLYRPTRLVIWGAYITVAAHAVSLKSHFSYRADVIGTLPMVVGMVGCGILAGFAVYLLSRHLLKLNGHDTVMASTLIGVQGPAPALLLTQIHREDWTELAAVTINYALLLPILAGVWLVISKTRWGSMLLPR